MLCDVQRERGFSHTGPSGYDYHLPVLQAARQFVKLVKTGWQAGDMNALAFLYKLKGAGYQVLQCRSAAAYIFIGY